MKEGAVGLRGWGVLNRTCLYLLSSPDCFNDQTIGRLLIIIITTCKKGGIIHFIFLNESSRHHAALLYKMSNTLVLLQF